MNNDVYTGADGAILLSGTDGNEGDAANEVIGNYEVLTVGRVQDIRIEVQSAVRAFHEIGQRYASQLRPGNVTVTGTVARAYLNGALLSLLLGDAAQGRPGGNWIQPSFNITVRLAGEHGVNTLTLHEVKFLNWVYRLPEDDFVLENAQFQALYLTVGED